MEPMVPTDGNCDQKKADAKVSALRSQKLARFSSLDFHPSKSSPFIYSAVEGTIPLILTSAHGGSIKPLSIPDRDSGVLTADLGTISLALLIAETISMRGAGTRPFVVVNMLSRRKVDPNRECTDEATGNNKESRAAYDSFHHCVDQACSRATKVGDGKALLIDIHGHGHKDDWYELGHLIPRSTLAGLDKNIPAPGAEWVRGKRSLGAYLMQAGRDAGYRAVPSPDIAHPGKQKYFSGGYITRRYRRDGIQTIQLEVPSCYRGKHSKESAPIIAEALMRLLSEWGYLSYTSNHNNSKM